MAKKFAQQKQEPNESLFAGTGKVPPQAIDFEESVLGALMIEKDAYLNISEILRPEHFYKEEHSKIFEAIIKLSKAHKPIDINTVAYQLKIDKELDNVGGTAYLINLTNRIASTAHIEYHARIIAQKYTQRELIRIGAEIQKKGFEDTDDVAIMIDSAEQEIFELSTGNVKKEVAPVRTVLAEAYAQLLEASKREDGLSGVPSGFNALDKLTLGWQPSDLIIIAARPAMGKTAFVLSMARNMAVDKNRGVAVFSLEMASVQLVNRIISSEAEIESPVLKTGKLSTEQWRHLEGKMKVLENAPLFIDDTPSLSITEFRSKIRRLVQTQHVEIAIIDYLQLMSAGDKMQSREQEISTISRSLKAIAKEVNIPIIALSQLNRQVETRTGNKRPQLSDLRESGAIEQDADMVIFIHRPEYYGLLTDENGNSTVGKAEIIVAKHRNGAVDDVTLDFKSQFTRFCDPEDNAPMTFQSKMNTSAATDAQPNISAGFTPNTDFDIAAPAAPKAGSLPNESSAPF
ncbi:MAG: replicative DNA helicase [Salinivirgaceae bacterium]|nr:replicative DNA helicase [Salinivirgaceae bacterium]